MADWFWRTLTYCPPHFKKGFFLFNALVILYKIWRITSRKEIKSCPKPQDAGTDTLNIRKALFFRNEGTACFGHVYGEPCEFGRYCPAYGLREIIDFIKSASVSIDICVLHLTMDLIEKAILAAFEGGVEVRIITDPEFFNEKSRIPDLRMMGIPVKIKTNSDFSMHNKFAVMDKKVLLTGSLNWTKQGLCGNWDNFMITSDPRLVSQYLEEFESIWSDLS
ncbi:unnamed protein product [Bemisia tabaci]|uniref:Mitochondrial cardiolipin hydrolase n=1 Tax=Bemisia tabaci TaxID=7038 RepID=A0A9P0F7N6_BEMTA|nr:PREDICTED: mitochondrial cardiolipin hydrolase [Bemisia tabaci]XP_018902767.1 PREDICTED: mitochondrial cardiolipin hydrolase [Bemisia tabaci]XP_018902776.1 PREDICTED: mitochondrial cardiolipin hydrolase [Bemisia tabaci]CAH0391336.1 unnamed protein product [Bemisia tabaci]